MDARNAARRGAAAARPAARRARRGFDAQDATPYNVQFRGALPVFVDVGSFEPLRDGEPWLGYRQIELATDSTIRGCATRTKTDIAKGLHKLSADEWEDIHQEAGRSRGRPVSRRLVVTGYSAGAATSCPDRMLLSIRGALGAGELESAALREQEQRECVAWDLLLLLVQGTGRSSPNP